MAYNTLAHRRAGSAPADAYRRRTQHPTVTADQIQWRVAFFIAWVIVQLV